MFLTALMAAQLILASEASAGHPFVSNAPDQPFLRSSLFRAQSGNDAIAATADEDGTTDGIRVAAGSRDPFAAPLGAEPEYGDSVAGKGYLDDPVYGQQGTPFPSNPGATGEDFDSCAETPILKYRKTCYQGATLSTGSLLSGSGQWLNIHHAAVSAGFGIPLETPENVVFVTPNFRADRIEAVDTVDAPDTLYETGVKFFHVRELTPTLNGIFSFAPAIRSDFTTGDGAFRIFGIAMLSWAAIPDELRLSAGMIYLDRSDIKALPAVGLLWTPSPIWRVDIQFPQPKISYRIEKNSGLSESWIYLAGGFGGNTWAVTRNSGQTDELTLRDLRLMAGWERLMANNQNVFIEAGWAFNRELEYTANPLVQQYGDALLLRAGLTF